MTLITLAVPHLVPFLLADNETERDAVLLECCDLPDKNLTLTEADLDGIVSRFETSGGNIPVKVQHIDSPLDPFGLVQSVRRVGTQLRGKISFPPAIAALVRERGAVALSCGLSREPLALAEVSLVLKGRLPSAVLLSDTEKSELLRLRAETLAQKVEAQVLALKLAGKIIPATEAAARVLLSAGDTSQGKNLVTLADGGGTQTVAEAFAAYLVAQPPLVTLGELTQLAASQTISATGEAELDADQRRFLEKSLGVDPDAVLQTLRGQPRAFGPQRREKSETNEKTAAASEKAAAAIQRATTPPRATAPGRS